MTTKCFRCAVLSVVKHAYVPLGVAAHPRFELAVVADDPDVPSWAHERNQLFADENGIPYVPNVEQALAEHDVQVAVVCSEAERHCDLSLRAIEAGLHVVQDKPMSTDLDRCNRVVTAVEQSGVKFLMWNRNGLPALVRARQLVQDGTIGQVEQIHADFYFAKDAGPPKGSRQAGDPPLDWLARQLEAHADGSDGGLGRVPLGELAVEGCYPLAYLRMFTDAKVVRVFARTTAHFHQAHVDNDVEDLASVSLEMQGGLLASLCIGRIGAASHPELGEIKLHILGSAGGLVISEARPEVGVYYHGQPATEWCARRVADDNDFLLMEDFAHAIDTNSTTMLDAAASRDICATVLAALESARTDVPIDISRVPSHAP